MTTYPLATLAPTIDATGVHVLPYSEIYQSLVASFQAIYGAGIYIDPDSQDGQWLGVLAEAIFDCGQATAAVYNSFRPTFAQGTGLSSSVKINGLTRNISTRSTCVGKCIGVAGTQIMNGVVQDINSNLWDLPALVLIPLEGETTVTVTAQKNGAIIAPTGTINRINTPQFNWQSFVNTADAAPGSAVETDAALRARQTISTALPALTLKEAILAAIGNVAGVTRYTIYENDTGITDANGLPAHSFSAVVQGGDSLQIATAIAGKKYPGGQTVGTTSVTVQDSLGIPVTIRFNMMKTVNTYYTVTIKALPGYTAATGAIIANTLTTFTNSIGIGEDIYAAQVTGIASLMNIPEGQTFYITDFKLGTSPNPTQSSNITIPFDTAAACLPANIAISVT